MYASKAFTLLELLIAISIVAILTVISVPLYSEYIETARLKGASETLYTSFLKARSEAIKSQGTVTFVFQTGTSWCFGANSTGTCDCNTAGSCNLGQIDSSSYSRVTLGLTGIGTSMTISGTRGVVSATGTVSFTSNDGDSVSVIINKMGFLRICSSNVSGYKSCS